MDVAVLRVSSCLRASRPWAARTPLRSGVDEVRGLREVVGGGGDDSHRCLPGNRQCGASSIKPPMLRSRPKGRSSPSCFVGSSRVSHNGHGSRDAFSVRAYGWPGNVRQLRNAMRYASMVADGEFVCTLHRSCVSASAHRTSEQWRLDEFHHANHPYADCV
jgi:hypothetical protein